MNKFSLVLCSVLVSTSLVQSTTIQPDIFQAKKKKKTSAINVCLKISPTAIMARNAAGQTVLHVAVSQADTALAIKFIKYGACVNAVDAQRKTSLDYAVESNNFKLARQLVKHGAKVTTVENAVRLKLKYKSRAAKFFITGLLFTPLLWIGSYFALNDAADVMLIA